MNANIDKIVKHYKKNGEELRKQHVVNGLDVLSAERLKLTDKRADLLAQIQTREIARAAFVANGSDSKFTPEDYVAMGAEIIGLQADMKPLELRITALDSKRGIAQDTWSLAARSMYDGLRVDLSRAFEDINKNGREIVSKALNG